MVVLRYVSAMPVQINVSNTSLKLSSTKCMKVKTSLFRFPNFFTLWKSVGFHLEVFFVTNVALQLRRQFVSLPFIGLFPTLLHTTPYKKRRRLRS